MVDSNRLVTTLQLKYQDSLGDFAWGQQLDGEILQSIEIQGIGNLKVPFSVEDIEKLKSVSEPAPYGKGMNVAVDPTLKNAWQTDGFKISKVSPTNFFHTTLAQISVKALCHLQLGWLIEDFDSNKMQVCIDKLMLFESGGHYKRHRKFELEQGVCAVMILQLPVQKGHLGGRLKIEHCSSTKYFEFGKDSNHCYFLTAFRSSCKHELEPITSGWRATLEINFIWKNALNVTKIPRTLSLLVPDILQLLTAIRASINPWFNRLNQVTQSPLLVPTDNPDCREKLANSEITTKEGHMDAFNLQIQAVMKHSPSLTSKLSRQLHFDLKIADIAGYYQNLEYSLNNGVRNCEGNPQKNTNTKNQKESVDLLVFLLENEYSLTDLSFFGLKGHDIFLSRLLLGGNFLDVHLAIMSQPNMLTNLLSKEEKSNSAVQMEHWINSTNTLIPFERIPVEANQIVSDFQGKSRLRCRTTTQEERNENCSTVPEHLHRQPVLVIWPRHQSFRMKCLYAFDALLNHMECQLPTASHEKSIGILRRIISFCCDEPLAVFIDSNSLPGERAYRLLHLCVFLRARQEGLNLLKLMSTDFHRDLCDESQDVYYEGIRSNEVAQIIAEFECRVSGWAACSRFVLEMITPIRLSNQVEYIISLAGYLMDRCCSEGAFEIMDHVAAILPKLDAISIANLGQNVVDLYVNFVIDCEAHPKSASVQRIIGFTTLFPHLDSYEQCRLVVDLRRRIRFGGIPSCMHLYQELFRAIPSCDLHTSATIKNIIVAVVSSFFQLGDPELIQLLMNKICLGSNTSNRSALKNDLIDVLFVSFEFWELATSSDLGKSMLSSLIEAQILSVKCMFDHFMNLSQENPSILHVQQTELEELDFKRKINLLENLSEIELQNQHFELVRNARITLITAWIDGFCQLLDRDKSIATPSSTGPFQVNIIVFLKTFIKMEKSHYDNNRQNISIDFSYMFSKMSIKKLCQLVLDLYKIDSVTQPQMKINSSSYNLYRDLYRQFVEKDIISLMTPTIKLVVKIAKCLFWLGDEVSLETFSQKICKSVSLNEENIFVKKIVSCNSVWPMASTSHSLAIFYALLDRHIDYLKTIKEPVFFFEQPCVQLPMYPEVEAFLRSPEERMSYHSLASIFHARSFADELTKVCLKNGWCSLKVQAMGSARSAWCEIVKTQDMHHMKMKRFQNVQQELSEMLSLRQNFEFIAIDSDLSRRLMDMHPNTDCIICPTSKGDQNEPEVIVISE